MSLRNLLLGPPLPRSAETTQRVSAVRAVGIFGLDALASTVYGPDEIFYVLALAGAAISWGVPVAVAIVLLLVIVTTSYRQTIFAYPNGGGSYTVARENLGSKVGIVAAVALMVDYLTNIAVSVTAGVAQIAAFMPGLYSQRVPLSVACVVVLMLINLRGVREASFAFLLPTYAFVGSVAVLVAWGLAEFLTGHLHPAPLHHVLAAPAEGFTLVLIVRAFAGGCTALTGIEAISNGVPVFTEPRARTAARTLLFLAGTLGALFLGITVLSSHVGAIPTGDQSVIAQVGVAVAGQGVLFYAVQICAAVVLILAANTSFNGFPALAATMARDNYLPQQFAHRGLRLVYSNGILVLGALAIALILLFGGTTHLLIPLFAVGVFLCFTLSQAGMVRHWLRTRGHGWRGKLVINAVGAGTTALVTLIMAATKFMEGAWLVLVLVPVLVGLILSIHQQYEQDQDAISPAHYPARLQAAEIAVIPVDTITQAVEEALAVGIALSPEVLAVHVRVDDAFTERLAHRWRIWGVPVPLHVIDNRAGDVVGSLQAYVGEIARATRGGKVTVVLPRPAPTPLSVLHAGAGDPLGRAFQDMANVVVLTVTPSVAGALDASSSARLRVL